MRAHVKIIKVGKEALLLQDAGGAVTIGEDAKAVVKKYHQMFPGRRIYYLNTIRMVDEILHEEGDFSGFNYPSDPEILNFD